MKDDIKEFLDYIFDKYPKRWNDISLYIKYVTPYMSSDNFLPTGFELKYEKKYLSIKQNDEVKLIEDKNGKYDSLIDHVDFCEVILIDFEQLFKDFNNTDFKIKQWSVNRKEFFLEKINEYLYKCNIYKGLNFFNELGKYMYETNEILKNLKPLKHNLYQDPNFLELEVINTLQLETNSLKEILIANYSTIHPGLESILNQKQSNNSYLKKDTWWKKIANLIAIGYFKIENRTYIINGDKIGNESEAARLIITELTGNDGRFETIKPILNETRSNTQGSKDIFTYNKLEVLKSIAESAEKSGKLSNYFTQRIKKIEESLY